MYSFLERTGTYGWGSDIEECLLSLLLNGDAGLLFAGRGANKTNGLKSLAGLVINDEDYAKFFHTYSLPNDEFEDMLGIPNPGALAQGRMEYIESDISIWKKKFILLSEVNRTNPLLQSKYLQLLDSRCILGRKTDVIWCFGDMNPLHYSGTTPLDPAFADRFALMLDIPEFYQLKDEDRVLAVGNHGKGSFYALNYWKPETRERIVENKSFSSDGMKDARERFNQLRREVLGDSISDDGLLGEMFSVFGEPTQNYLSRVTGLMAKSIEDTIKTSEERALALELLTSGRRNSMILRSILTRLAVRSALEGCSPSKEEVSELVKDTYLKSLTIKATGMEFDVSSFEVSHQTAVQVIKAVGNPWDYKIETETNPVKKLAMSLTFKINPKLGPSPDLEDKFESAFTILDPSLDIVALSIKDKSVGFSQFNILENFGYPILLPLYCQGLIDCNNSILSPEIKARIASYGQNIFTRMNREWFSGSSEAQLVFLGEKTTQAVYKYTNIFNTKYEETQDPYYKLSVTLLQHLMTLTLELTDTSLKEEDLHVWVTSFEEIAEGFLKIHEDCYTYLAPVIRKLLSESGIDVGKTPEEIKKDMSALISLFRN